MNSRRALLGLSAFIFFHLLQTVNAQANSTTTDPNEQCGFLGDTDTYGLGIRIGLYIQWITTSIAYNFVPEEAPNIRGVNTAFQLSNFAGLLYITFSRGSWSPSGQLFAVECWIVLIFCLGGIATGKGYHTDHTGGPHVATFATYDMTALGAVIQACLGAALAFYSVWFVFVGMDTMLHPPCSHFAFFFAKVDLYGRFRTFLKVLFTISAVGVSVTIFVLAFLSFRSFDAFKELLGIPPRPSADAEKVTVPTLPSERQTPDKIVESGQTRLRNVTLSFSMMIFIISTELVIRWNRIEGVNVVRSTGQILPIVAAASSFIDVMWQFVIKVIKGDFVLDDSFNFQLLCFQARKSNRKPRPRMRAILTG